MHEPRFEIGTSRLRIDLLRRAVRYDDVPVALSLRELDLLVRLVIRRPALVSRAELLREVFGIGFDPGTNVVEVHISRLRAKLEDGSRPRLVENVRGRGYRLVERPVSR